MPILTHDLGHARGSQSHVNDHFASPLRIIADTPSCDVDRPSYTVQMARPPCAFKFFDMQL
jgi:hypothetical protein